MTRFPLISLIKYPKTYKAIADINKNSKFFKLKDIVESIMTNPTFYLKNAKKMQFTDDADHYFAFVCNEKYVIIDNYDWCIKFNVHNMDIENRYYYLELYCNDECLLLRL